MADRFIAVAKEDVRLQGKWLPVSVYFEAVETDKYGDSSNQLARKVGDKFTLRNFKRSINKKYAMTFSNFKGDHDGVLAYYSRVRGSESQ